MSIDYRFKILYAIGIIFVVIGHCGGGGINILSDWFPPYAFHLQLFAFASGYFYKSSSEEYIGKYILKKIKTLLVPLYCWNFFYGLVVIVLSFKGFTIGFDSNTEMFSKLLILPITTGHQFMYNLGWWFVIPLFMVQIYNVLARKIFSLNNKKINEGVWYIFNLLLGMIGVYLASKDFRFGWWLVLVRMLFILPFFSLGIYYKRKLEKYDKLGSITYFILIFMSLLVVLYIYGRIPTYSACWCHDFVDGPIMPYIIGSIGIAFWLRVSRILEPIIGKNKYINLISDNAFSIMINQLMAFMIVKTIFAFISKFTNLCYNFDWSSYKTDVWYLYLPKNIEQMKIIYIFAGIVIPILIKICITKLPYMLLNKKIILKNLKNVNAP